MLYQVSLCPICLPVSLFCHFQLSCTDWVVSLWQGGFFHHLLGCFCLLLFDCELWLGIGIAKCGTELSCFMYVLEEVGDSSSVSH